MRLYKTATGGFVGTQDEARQGGRGWVQIDVPTTKAELLVWLNINARPAPAPMRPDIPNEEMDDAGQPVTMPMPVSRPVPLTVTGAVPDPTLLSIEEFIQAADGGALASIASNVAWRFKELAKLFS